MSESVQVEGGSEREAAAESACCAAPTPAGVEVQVAAAPCCGTSKQAAAESSCCGSGAKAEAVASGAGCCG